MFRIYFRYIFFELVPAFLLGNLVFVGIILMFQGLRLAEFALIHGFGAKLLFEIMAYMTISVLPALLPMSLLFAVLMTYSRLSSDSEVVAMKAVGLSSYQIIFPGLIFGGLISLIAAQLTFETGPWGNRRFEVIVSSLTNTKAGVALREGTFMEGFFEMMVYAHKIDSEKGRLEKVFIYDERQNPPLTIIAKQGQMVQKNELTGNEVKLTLENGDMHRKTKTHTKIEFDKFFITLNENYQLKAKDKTLASMTLNELKKQFNDPSLEKKIQHKFSIEYQKRWCLTILPFVLALIGVVLGLTTHQRGSKGSGFVICVGLIVLYWVLFVLVETSIMNLLTAPSQLLWLPNIIFTLMAIFIFHKKERLT